MKSAKIAVIPFMVQFTCDCLIKNQKAIISKVDAKAYWLMKSETTSTDITCIITSKANNFSAIANFTMNCFLFNNTLS